MYQTHVSAGITAISCSYTNSDRGDYYNTVTMLRYIQDQVNATDDPGYRDKIALVTGQDLTDRIPASHRPNTPTGVV